MTINLTDSISAAIDGDAFAALAAADEKTAYFYQMQPVFEEIQLRANVKYLYAIAQHGDGIHYRYIFDAEGEDFFGELDVIDEYGAEDTFATGARTSDLSDTEEHGSLISGFSPIYDRSGRIVGAVGADLSIEEVMAEINQFALQIVTAAVLFNLLFIVLIHLYLNRALGRPIRALTRLGESMARGELETNERIDNNDEIGLLAASFTHVGDTLRRLIGDMKTMSAQQKAGDYEALIDVDRYEGAFHAVASDINGIARENTRDFTDMIAAFNALENGEFDTDIRRFPGKKEIINTAIDSFRASLKGLNDGILTLATSATRGDLSKTIDAEKFKGGWHSLATELNLLMATVLRPIQEAELALAKMSDGDFTVSVTGDYQGAFAIIKNAINKTQASISAYIGEISDILRQMSAQQLNVQVTRPYVGDFSIIRDSINLIIETMNHTLGDINASSEQVAIGAKQIAEISGGISRSTTDQASAVEELNASIDQISTQTNKNAETADKARSLALEARNNTEKEAVMMQETLSAMEGINEASEHISKIIKAIEDISFQSNILALNASVEAARAGVHGKGFAVVAEEVSNLAHRSQTAAKETAVLIEGSVKKARDGARVTKETAELLKHIVNQISNITDYIQAIAQASEEQRENILQIGTGISQIAKATQSNMATIQESAASAEELSAQATLLKSNVGKFALK